MKITVGITVFNRPEYVEKMAKSLYSIDGVNGCNIRIYDDCSTAFNMDYLKTKFPTAKQIIRRNQNMGSDYNIRQMFVDFLQTDDDYLIAADSDLIFHPKFLDIISGVIDYTDGVLSLYNSASHKNINNVVVNGIEMIEKMTIGSAGAILHRKVVEYIVSNVPSSLGYDLTWSSLLRNRGIRLLVTKRSYIQHIGTHGYNTNLSFQFDYGNNFIPGNDVNADIQSEYIEEILEHLNKDSEYKRLEMSTLLSEISERRLKSNTYYLIGYKLLIPARIAKHLLRNIVVIFRFIGSLANRVGLYLWLKYLRIWLNLDVNLKLNVNNDIPIDIVIPAIEKDLKVLPVVIKSLRKNLKHPIGKLSIVAPKMNKIILFCEDNNCSFIDESELFPFDKSSMSYVVDGVDRNGWLFQQFIKLSGDDRFGVNDNYLVVDADTVLLRPQVFIFHSKTIFNCSDEYHDAYYNVYEKMLKYKTKSPMSFVSHMMLINKKVLTELQKEIEQKNGCKWFDAIITNIDRNESSSFSEYETYANYLYTKYPNKCILEYWANLSLSVNNITNYDDLVEKYSKKYKSVSFHSYNKGTITSKLMGGMGNQMFQYACGRMLTKKYDRQLNLDTSFLEQGLGCTKRVYRLGEFKIEGHLATSSTKHNYLIVIKKLLIRLYKIFFGSRAEVIRENQTFIHQEILFNRDVSVMDGYWQNEAYFSEIRDKLLIEFTPKNELPENVKGLLAKIRTQNSISIHFRRGDYVDNPQARAHHGECSMEYYYEAIKMLIDKISDPIFFVFSDDIPWVKENLKIAGNVVYVENTEEYQDLFLMSQCKHNIIANSSFSWWGAWLNNNPGKIVIAPNRWLLDEKSNARAMNLIPEGWVKL